MGQSATGLFSHARRVVDRYTGPSLLSLVAAMSSALGCGTSDDKSASLASGGTVAAGGATAAGGSTLISTLTSSEAGASSATGGRDGVGGTLATGGQPPATGGKIAVGGSSGVGGANPTGGKPTTGGVKASGGQSATGGAPESGGTSASTVNTVTGGATASGGTTSNASTLSTGGASPSGGTTSSGTKSSTGGTSAAGGTSAVAGSTSAVAGGSNRSAGCGTPITRPNPRTQQTVTIGGATRYYLLDVPTAADNSTPLMLIFALHGYDMNNVAIVGLYNFTSRSNGKAITVYPQGEGPAPGDTSHWGDSVLKSTWTANDANYTFIQTLMKDLESRYCIDPSRLFITGFSMGGMFTNSLACAHNDWFRGYAPVEGGGPGSCADANAKPAIIIHQGSADTIAKPSAGEGTRDFWTKQNGCNQTTTSTLTGCQSFGACDEPVLYCVGDWTHTIDSRATANIWSFFSGLQ